MEGIALTSFLACFIFVITLHTFYQSIHARNHPATPASSSISSPSRRILRVGVPRKTTFTEFVSVEKNGTNFVFGGFCVEVFKAAIITFNYSIEYIPVLTSEVKNMGFNDYMIHLIVIKKLDAVVGDFTITSQRSKEVEFTKPFLDSGLVAVVPLKNENILSFGWAFVKPFTGEMWLLTVAFFISGGLVVYILERRNKPQFQGQPAEQFGNILRFSFPTWFINHDDVGTVMGRIVIVAWLFVFGILQSCYTANLSAILTATRLEPTLDDMSRVAAASNVRIGYHTGSPFADLLQEYYGISKHRLVPLSKAGYYDALTRGHVGAIVDGRPYMQSLVAKHCSHLAIAGQPFTALNWGFAFDRMDYELVRDISLRILELSENGELHRLRKKWLPYYDRDCGKYSDQSGTSPLQVQHFWGLFVISGFVSAIVLLFYTVQRKWNSCRVVSPTRPPPEGSSGSIPPTKDLSGYGGGGFIPEEDYGGSLELIKKNQFLSGPTPPPEYSSGYTGGGFNPGEDCGGSLGPMKKIQRSYGTIPPPEDSSRYGRGSFIPGQDYGGSLELTKKIQCLRRTKSLTNVMPFVEYESTPKQGCFRQSTGVGLGLIPNLTLG